MSRIDDEVKFLKRFRSRFDTRSEWIAALVDMLDEGMITRIAYNRAIEKPVGNKMIPAKSVVKKLLTKKKSPSTSIISGCDRPIDPCGTRAMRYDSCSSNRSSC